MIEKIKSVVLKSKPVLFLVAFAKKIILPGFDGIPLYNVLEFFYHGVTKGAITTRASSIAFSFFLAIFPSIIFLFTLIPYIPIDNFQNELMDLIKGVLPRSAYDAAESTLEDIIKRQNSSLLSFGFIAALYFATDGFNSMITAFNQTYHDIETRTPFTTRVISLVLVLISVLIIIVAIILLIFTEIILGKLSFSESFDAYLILFGRWLILFALFFSVISFIYYLGPATKLKWKFVTVGSTFTSILSIITSLGFTYYVNNFGQYNKLYGSIGTLIVILLWIYFNSVILLLGFELNASIHNAKGLKKEIPISS